jgi:hypothetical protein
LAFETVLGQVHGNSVEPRIDLRFATEGIPCTVRVDERVLGEVSRLLGIVDEASVVIRRNFSRLFCSFTQHSRPLRPIGHLQASEGVNVLLDRLRSFGLRACRGRMVLGQKSQALSTWILLRFSSSAV